MSNKERPNSLPDDPFEWGRSGLDHSRDEGHPKDSLRTNRGAKNRGRGAIGAIDGEPVGVEEVGSKAPAAKPQKSRSAYLKALDLLSIRAHSVKDLRTKLLQRDFPDAEVNTTLDRLLENGLLNDSSYAESYVRGKLSAGRASPRKISRDLVRKGISKDYTDSALEKVIEEDGIDPREAMEALAHKKLRQMKGDDPVAAKRKLFAFLARRGYDLGDIQDVVGRLIKR